MKRYLFAVAFVVVAIGCSMTKPALSPAVDGAIIRYDSIHHPTIARNGMVVSQNETATRVGQQVLAAGGNAVDAAVAVGFALAVTLPRAGNLGGSGFMLLHLSENQETVAFDYRSMAPAGATLASFTKNDEIDWDAMTFGAQAAGVPGTVAALHQAWQRYGSLPWDELLEPAQTLARDGIQVSRDLAYALAASERILSRFPSSAKTYLNDAEKAPVAGDVLRQPDLAWSIGEIMRDGADAFYLGRVAERIIGSVKQAGGSMTLQDLAAYKVRERSPLRSTYRGHRVVAAPLVSSGGATLLQMLNVLGHFDLSEYRAGSARTYHLLAEVMKRSAANRRVGLGDPDFVNVDLGRYLSDEVAAELAATIDLERATAVEQIKPNWMESYESRDTTHFSVIDGEGNAVSNTYTLGYSFGSGFVADGTGILLDNQIRNFSHRPGDVHANSMVTGKRMLSTMTPTMVFDNRGELMLVTGTPGGSRIINVILQVIVNVVDFEMGVAEATSQPRIHQPWRTPKLAVEAELNPDTRERLRAMGHIIDEQQTMGSTQSIQRRDGLLFGAPDPRRPGSAALGYDKPPPATR